MTDEEYTRENNRLKQARFRKRARARKEGLPDDYYVTDEDYITRDTALIASPALAQETREETSPALRKPRADYASAAPPVEPDHSPLWWKIIKGAAFIGFIILVGIAQANKIRSERAGNG